MFETLLARHDQRSSSALVVYEGELTAAEFISTAQLTTAVGLVSYSYLAEAAWIHVTYNGKTIMFPKVPIANYVRFNNLLALGIVDGQKTVSINGKDYMVRLPSCLTSPLTYRGDVKDHFDTHGSEWNQIMYRLVGGAKPSNPVLLSEQPFDFIAGYSEYDLRLMAQEAGCVSYMQDHKLAASGGVEYVMYAGWSGVSNTCVVPENIASNQYYGWRPFLELIN